MKTRKPLIYLGWLAALLQLSGACVPPQSIASLVFTPSQTIQATLTASAVPASPTPSPAPERCYADFIPLGFWPDSNHLLGQQSADNQDHSHLQVLDLTTGQFQTILELQKPLPWNFVTVWASLTADRSLIGIPQPGGDSIQIFDLDRQQELFRLTGKIDPNTTLAFSPKDDKLYTSYRGSVNVWDMNGALRSTFAPTFTFLSGSGHARINTLAVSPDGTQLAASPILRAGSPYTAPATFIS